MTHFRYRSERHGEIALRVNPRARNIIARMTPDGPLLTIPEGTSAARIEAALDQLLPRLQKRAAAGATPLAAADFDGRLQLEGFTFTFSRQDRHPSQILYSHDASHAAVSIGSAVDLDTPAGQQFVSRVMADVARQRAGALLLPRARQIAARLAAAPSAFRITHGKHRLGTCSASGVISLSYYLLFLPTELRDYVICHELAHLRHFDHSAAFHALCNSYLDGREKHLVALLKSYRWPLLR